MPDAVHMTPEAFAKALAELGFTDAAAGVAMGCDERTVRRWRNGERGIPGPVAALVDLWLRIADRVGLTRAHRTYFMPSGRRAGPRARKPDPGGG